MVYLLHISATEYELCLFLDDVTKSDDILFTYAYLSYTAEFSAIRWYVTFLGEFNM